MVSGLFVSFRADGYGLIELVLQFFRQAGEGNGMSRHFVCPFWVFVVDQLWLRGMILGFAPGSGRRMSSRHSFRIGRDVFRRGEQFL
jgi:hypothetical protein